MTDKVYKLIELVGTSSKSSDDAIQNAINRAADTLRNLDWFEVVETRGTIQNGKVTCYQVSLRVGFRLE
ncbi:MAG: dodecin [Pseudomonadota bacterium]